ncbi:MAG TPA: prephenate dehydrogenase/arogenate dehydrogenase family protein [Longimicrobium sp.]|nr:prephenate dehydrogenase/arogenate dehydrogenase family protein [Longimicrobium sp.]
METGHDAGIRSVAIVGLGLIGGSLARDLAARGVRVYASDADYGTLQKAITLGIVAGMWDEERVDAVVFAVPVLEVPVVTRWLMDRLDGVRLITDAGSTKRSIVARAEKLGWGDRFVGSHPLAGDHRSGWDASRAGLFDGARVFLCPTPSTSGQAMELAAGLWTMVGGRPEVVDADEHDRRLAWTSHLPQAVSSTLGRALAGQGIGRVELGPGGRDVTRLAGSSPEMWADIALDNADALLPALEAMEAELRALRDALSAGDRERLRALFAAAREWHGG